MPRHYRRRRYAISRPVKTAKYDNCTFAAGFSITGSSQHSLSLTTATTVGGTRKCKNFTLSFNAAVPGFWALVYVPEGNTVGNLNFATPQQEGETAHSSASLYEPNQNVIMSGVTRPTSEVYRVKTRLARNLNSGDGIYFVFRPATTLTESFNVTVSCNYAIAY